MCVQGQVTTDYRGFGDTTRGPLWGISKVNFQETLSSFGDKCPQNGSKNGLRAPRTGMGCPHIGPSVGTCTRLGVEERLERDWGPDLRLRKPDHLREMPRVSWRENPQP